MFFEESLWINKTLKKLKLDKRKLVLNIGSSSLAYNKSIKNYIWRNIYSFLKSKNIRLINCDIKKAEGIDEVIDLNIKSSKATIKKYNPYVVLCCNILEHLENPKRLAKEISFSINPGSYVIVTCPYKYPYHPDPIDNLLRPTPLQLFRLFENFDLVEKKIIKTFTFKKFLISDKMIFLKYFIRLLIPFYKPRSWFSQFIKLFWLSKTFKVSCILIKKQ